MTLTNIQNIAAQCYAMASSGAANAASWAGRNIHALGRLSLDTGKSILGDIEFAATKCAALANSIFSGACMYTNMGWQVAKYLGARSWECARTGGTYSLEKASSLFSAIVRGGSYTLNSVASGICKGSSALAHGASKVGAFSVEKIAQFGTFTKDVALAAGKGALQGLQISKNFVATHPKEFLIGGGALTIGLAVGYATAHLLNPSQESI